MARPSSIGIAVFLAIYPMPVLNAPQNYSHSANTAEESTLSGWQPNPDNRGTFNIIVSCLLTILASTWTIQHLNIPNPKQTGRLAPFRRTLKWMVLNIFVPEIILTQAIDERMAVSRAMEKLDKENEETVDSLFVVRWATSLMKLPEKDDGQSWTRTHCYYGNMGGFLVEDRRNPNTHYAINALEAGDFGRFRPPVRLEEIKDKSKSNAFTKGIAAVQIMWMVISALARAVIHLPLSQLEVVTVVFAITAVVTYRIRRDKPQSVEIGSHIGPWRNDQRPSPTQLWFSTKKSPPRQDFFPNTTIQTEPEVFWLWLLVTMTGIGAVHILAWNFAFPTSIEKTLWRCASAISTGIPGLILVVTILSFALTPVVYLYKQEQRRTDSNDFRTRCRNHLQQYRSERTEEGDTGQDGLYGNAIDKLDGEATHYTEIFQDFSNQDLKGLVNQLPTGTDDAFAKNFKRLYDIILSRRLQYKDNKDTQQDMTDIFPSQTEYALRGDMWRWPLRRGMLPCLGVIYTISRLALIAEAFASLRGMPEGVYVETWSRYIPLIQ